MNDDARNRRASLGFVGFYGAIITFSVVCCLFVILQASFHTWAVGKYFAGRAVLFADVFLVSGLISILTAVASFFDQGRRRSVGVLLSLSTLVGVVLIFWINP